MPNMIHPGLMAVDLFTCSSCVLVALHLAFLPCQCGIQHQSYQPMFSSGMPFATCMMTVHEPLVVEMPAFPTICFTKSPRVVLFYAIAGLYFVSGHVPDSLEPQVCIGWCSKACGG